MASLALDSLKYVVGSRVLVKMNNGLSIKGEIIAYEPNHKIVMISKSLQKKFKVLRFLHEFCFCQFYRKSGDAVRIEQS